MIFCAEDNRRDNLVLDLWAQKLKTPLYCKKKNKKTQEIKALRCHLLLNCCRCRLWQFKSSRRPLPVCHADRNLPAQKDANRCFGFAPFCVHTEKMEAHSLERLPVTAAPGRSEPSRAAELSDCFREPDHTNGPALLSICNRGHALIVTWRGRRENSCNVHGNRRARERSRKQEAEETAAPLLSGLITTSGWGGGRGGGAGVLH